MLVNSHLKINLIHSTAMRHRTGSPGCNVHGAVNPISAPH
jgi:hypothetical protein